MEGAENLWRLFEKISKALADLGTPGLPPLANF